MENQTLLCGDKMGNLRLLNVVRGSILLLNHFGMQQTLSSFNHFKYRQRDVTQMMLRRSCLC